MPIRLKRATKLQVIANANDGQTLAVRGFGSDFTRIFLGTNTLMKAPNRELVVFLTPHIVRR